MHQNRLIKTYSLLIESVAFAIGSLKSNLLRTVLSLLGVTVGIFSIIAVYTLVDSLENNIKDSMNFLGSDVIYIQKFPWTFDDPNYPWWKYMKRPATNVDEFAFLERNLKYASGVGIFATQGGLTVKYRNNSVSKISMQGVSYGFSNISNVTLEKGRYFTQQEIQAASQVAIIGSDIAKGLFSNQEPLGKMIKVKGRNLVVIGVMARQGSNFLGTPSADNNVLVPYGLSLKLFSSGRRGAEPMVGIKGLDSDPGLVNLEGELRGLLRSYRKLKPKEEDSFALNRPEMITNVVSAVFKVISFAGSVIGSFALLVGGFGIANIMFVSVKERTNIIGIQKALGAKQWFILMQFLFEAIFLSLIGGMVGLILVVLITFIPQDTMQIVLSTTNVVTGVIISCLIGVVSGIAPAMVAARLDPVEAIRSK
jgi:putative ABC transport system permease protein